MAATFHKLYLQLLLIVALASCCALANVKAVFAHFMVSNTANYTIADWENDFTLARDAKIDGFVMNMGRNEATNGQPLADAFTAASNLDNTFKLLFSFDYAGNGLWAANDVITLIKKYKDHGAYFKRGSQPLVSTFEGPKAAGDWPAIKLATGCFFMPSWSSLGAKPAWEKGAADGLFSWAAWPTGPQNMDTFTDASYLDVLNGKPYMMGVSPWFFTNMPGFRKNWLWRGDSLWFDRWINVLFLRPEYVQIIAWNDYGESHYIGPLRAKGYEAFDRGNAPYNYAINKNHNAWRNLLPNLIDMAKTNVTTISRETFVAWHRPHPKSACGTGGTTGNTASQLQPVFSPSELVEDRVFFAAILGSSASITVSIGGVASAGTWDYEPSNGVGLYRGSAPFAGRTGQVTISLVRGGTTLLSSTGDSITTSCTQNLQNWNPYVIGNAGRAITAVSPLSLSTTGCTSGFGDEKYQNLCEIACRYDYCPRGACTCTNIGAKRTRPAEKNLFACPAPGVDSTYLGLCAMVCNYASCPSVCQIVPAGTVCKVLLPVAPPVPVCVKGMAIGDYARLCSMACARGFCPPEICSCTQAGTASDLPSETLKIRQVTNPNAVGTFRTEEDYGLCAFACPRGLCPSALCICTGSQCPSGSATRDREYTNPTKFMALRAVVSQLTDGCVQGNYCFRPDLATANCGDNTRPVGAISSSNCAEDEVNAICCPNSSGFTMETCQWRSGYDGFGACNGKCLDHEVSWGDGDRYGADVFTMCFTGKKMFCCKAPDATRVINQCKWTPCGVKSCGPGEVALASKFQYCSKYLSDRGTQSFYCCPKNGSIKECTWRGEGPRCADSECQNTEISVLKDDQGAYHENFNFAANSCSFNSDTDDLKSLCCKADIPKSSTGSDGTCGLDNFCEIVNPTACDEYKESDEPIEGEEDDELDLRSVSKRLVHHHHHHQHQNHTFSELEERGKNNKDFKAIDINYIMSGITRRWTLNSRRYRRRGLLVSYFRRPATRRVGDSAWYYPSPNCWEVGVVEHPIGAVGGPDDPPADLDAEHVVDYQVLRDFILFTQDLQLTRPQMVSTQFRGNPIPGNFWAETMEANLQGLSPMGETGREDIPSPNARLGEHFGSRTNNAEMVLLHTPTNIMKSSIISSQNAVAQDNFKKMVAAAVGDGDPTETNSEDFLRSLRNAVNVFDYVRTSNVSNRFRRIIGNVRAELIYIEGQLRARNPALPVYDLAQRWDEFTTLYFAQSAAYAQEWLEEYGDYAIQEVQAAAMGGPLTQQASIVVDRVLAIQASRSTMVWPGFGKGKGKEIDRSSNGSGSTKRMVANVTDVDSEIDVLVGDLEASHISS